MSKPWDVKISPEHGHLVCQHCERWLASCVLDPCEPARIRQGLPEAPDYQCTQQPDEQRTDVSIYYEMTILCRSELDGDDLESVAEFALGGTGQIEVTSVEVIEVL